MNSLRKYSSILALFVCFILPGCKMLTPVMDKDKPMPDAYAADKDSTNSAQIKWKDFFKDKNLVALIDTALRNNQELQIALQNIEIARNDVRMRKGRLFPVVNGGVGAGVDKVGRYTSAGAGDASTEMTPGVPVPENLGDLFIGVQASWQVDIWKKLRNGKKAAVSRYLATIEGKNFVVTNLVAEIARAYYELLSLDDQMAVVQKTIELQKNALEIVKVQKEASVVTELAVKKFEAEVLDSQSRQYEILQEIKETENEINFLLGRFPQPVVRDTSDFLALEVQQAKTGVPSQLLANRPDIREAKLELFAAKCDVKSAQAEFFPEFNITGGAGFNAFKPSYLFTTPESIIYSIAGDLMMPLINRNAIKAEFNSAKAEQVKAMVDYQKAILNGYIEVSNELSGVNNLQQVYDLKSKQVDALNNSIEISNDLFSSGRVDYFEVLMTQRDALETKLELIETKNRQFDALINIYQALGGGWN
ncbi:MAG: TolC family protein [Bacteroidia bacterium]